MIGKVETQACAASAFPLKTANLRPWLGHPARARPPLAADRLPGPTYQRAVYINGKDVSQLNRNQRATCGAAPSLCLSVLCPDPTLTAYENIEMPLLLIGRCG